MAGCELRPTAFNGTLFCGWHLGDIDPIACFAFDFRIPGRLGHALQD
jgi:hypothetical protein